MARLRTLLLCPGRGSYSRAELGSLAGVDAVALDHFEAYRAAQGEPGPRALDAAERFSPRLHLAGEHASILTAGASLADMEQIDAERYESVGVMGNSMGWYTALGAAGALDLDDCAALIDTMGSYQSQQVIGGQLVYPLTDEDWRVDPAALRLVNEAVADIPDLHWSIRLGGQAILCGTEAALEAATTRLPPVAGKGLSFPLLLPLHSAFHTPLMAPTRDRAETEQGGLGWRAPTVTLIDGRGACWRPRFADPAALRAYTLGAQVTETFDFSTMVSVALGELAPDRIILTGPGSNLGGAVAQVLIALGWQGITSRADFQRRQESAPLLLAMGRPDQRALVLR